ncbi:hypothetical protein [Pseudobutyrivibrio xylanivorans]|uniref:Camelysin metallo-endopeptidase n=1 Tax=Pseudobutyrivibrio xylanivorans TaxID=185007 RepID=A0A5P6VM22_PSEXY|nr:hypothetical protein [Pseudobutyrivibrio xylanivorans]QFJ53607.1 hypothetical protein FXF36_01345 [Pseudobutyrivibrio xylanivorans]
MKFKKYMLVAAALLIIGGVAVKPAMAYFTDSHETTGSIQISLGDSKLTPKDSADGLLKTVSVTNTSNYDAFVRVKAIYSKNFSAAITDKAKENGWSEKDGYFYYAPVLAAGESTPDLKIQISVVDNSIADSFNVVIIEEATRVIYDSEGNTSCDWNSKVMNREDYDAKFRNTQTQEETSTEDEEIDNEEVSN